MSRLLSRLPLLAAFVACSALSLGAAGVAVWWSGTGMVKFLGSPMVLAFAASACFTATAAVFQTVLDRHERGHLQTLSPKVIARMAKGNLIMFLFLALFDTLGITEVARDAFGSSFAISAELGDLDREELAEMREDLRGLEQRALELHAQATALDTDGIKSTDREAIRLAGLAAAADRQAETLRKEVEAAKVNVRAAASTVAQGRSQEHVALGWIVRSATEGDWKVFLVLFLLMLGFEKVLGELLAFTFGLGVTLVQEVTEADQAPSPGSGDGWKPVGVVRVPEGALSAGQGLREVIRKMGGRN